MKKVIFGILSIFLISPVFSYDVSPSWIHNSVIELNSSISHSVLYLQGGIGDTSLYSKNPDGSLYLYNPLFFSLNQSDFGSIINSDNLSLLYGLSGSTNNTFSNGYGLISFGLYNNIPLLDYQWLYLQRFNSDGYNYSYSFSTGYLDVNSADYTIGNLGNFYLRNFYNNNSLISYEIFSKDYNYVLTNNGRIYDSVGSGKVAVFPSILDGYSSISLDSSGGLVFNTVFPGFSQFKDSNNHLPSFVETDKFIIFPLNGDSYDTTNSYYGVLAILGTGFAFSEYSCNGLSYTEYGDGVYYLNLAESCEFIDGGLSSSYYDYSPIVSNNYSSSCYDFYGSFKFIPFYSFFSNSSFPVSTYYGSTNYTCVLPSNNTSSSFYGSRDSLYVNVFLDGSNLIFTSIDNNTCVRSRTSTCPSSVAQNIWSGYVTSLSINLDGSIDILSKFDNTKVPLTPSKVENLLDIYCNELHLINPALCGNGGPSIGSGMYTYEPIVSGDQVILVITDYSDANDYIIHTGDNGEVWVECVGDWCPIYHNTGSDEIGSVGGSGFILDTGYYDNFFQKTGYFGKCPYSYTDYQFGEKLKVFNAISEALGGFDIFLPINCSIAAFFAGKTYNFLSDVNLGSSPLMGYIENSNDPRVYLYRFFDFLMAFALLIFLLKLYHLLN